MICHLFCHTLDLSKLSVGKSMLFFPSKLPKIFRSTNELCLITFYDANPSPRELILTLLLLLLSLLLTTEDFVEVAWIYSDDKSNTIIVSVTRNDFLLGIWKRNFYWWYVLFSVSFSNKLWCRTVNHRTFSFFLWVSHHILTQLYQNYNHPDTVPEVDQSEPVLDFQEGEKENSDKKMKVKLLNILKTVSTQVLLEGQKE